MRRPCAKTLVLGVVLFIRSAIAADEPEFTPISTPCNTDETAYHSAVPFPGAVATSRPMLTLLPEDRIRVEYAFIAHRCEKQDEGRFSWVPFPLGSRPIVVFGLASRRPTKVQKARVVPNAERTGARFALEHRIEDLLHFEAAKQFRERKESFFVNYVILFEMSGEQFLSGYWMDFKLKADGSGYEVSLRP